MAERRRYETIGTRSMLSVEEAGTCDLSGK
jgi:hypothetical protein